LPLTGPAGPRGPARRAFGAEPLTGARPSGGRKDPRRVGRVRYHYPVVDPQPAARPVSAGESDHAERTAGNGQNDLRPQRRGALGGEGVPGRPSSPPLRIATTGLRHPPHACAEYRASHGGGRSPHQEFQVFRHGAPNPVRDDRSASEVGTRAGDDSMGSQGLVGHFLGLRPDHLAASGDDWGSAGKRGGRGGSAGRGGQL